MTATDAVLGRSGSQAQGLPVITPATGSIGAWITGLDIRGDYSPEVRALLFRALHEHGVLFTRQDHDISPADHARFSEVFGELHERHVSEDGGAPAPAVIDNAQRANVGTEIWHTDTTVVPNPPAVAVLRTPVLPEVGGDTLWASMYAAYDALSPRMQAFLEGLEAVHDSEMLLNARPTARAAGLFSERKSAVHPVVIRDHVTGRPALYVNSNYVSKIVGLSDTESAGLLTMLFDHVTTPDFHVRLKWDIRTLAIWDERVTQHRAVGGYEGHRVLHRYWLKGPAPVAYGHIVP